MDKYGLIGFPLKHSFSSKFFAEKFKRENIDAEYNNYEIPFINELISIIEKDHSLKGLNVTIPFKEKVIPFLSSLDDMAQDIGAVNVIKVIRSGDSFQLIGYNSDVIGFCNSIRPMIDKIIHHKALILGTGGAAKAVYTGLKNLNIEPIYVSRSAKVGALTYQGLNKDVIDEYKVIVNASPLGTFPDVDVCPDIPYQYLTPDHLLYDLVYNPPITKFLALGEEKGSKIKNGNEMLELQALAAWDIWNN